MPKEIDIPEKTLVDFLEDSVKKYPDNVVTYFMGFELTYTQLLDIVYRVATKLTELGLKKGDCVAIHFTNNPAFVCYYYCILKMAGLTVTAAELNTLITMLGCLCATIQGATGAYAAYYKKRLSLLKTNDILFRAHRAFGAFATTLYFLGLFAGLTGFLGAILPPKLEEEPPFEIEDLSFNIHVWASFLIIGIIDR